MTEPGWETLGVGGALLARYRGDLQALLEQLATFLEGTLPAHTAVHRTLGIMGPRRATRLTVTLNDQRFELERGPQNALEARRTRVVRGVALKTETLAIEAWVQELGTTLSSELERSATGRAALAKLFED